MTWAGAALRRSDRAAGRPRVGHPPDAANLQSLRLPRAVHDRPEWQAAAEALLLVAERGGSVIFAGIGIMRALNAGKSEAENRRRAPGSTLGPTGSTSLSLGRIPRHALLGLKHSFSKHLQLGNVRRERFETLTEDNSGTIRSAAETHCARPIMLVMEELTRHWGNREKVANPAAARINIWQGRQKKAVQQLGVVPTKERRGYL
jgi:hypothetical protein